ncbi:MAG: acyltransferase family protein [Rhodobacteraceae bacterium]|nr:acyltransferase family protein [Paracoccaceae bacterium]
MDTQHRLDWVDAAKGICIILVVMFHATLHLTPTLGASGFAWFTHFFGPFRMPDFFLISGLFLSRRLSAPAAIFYDRKVLHFFYYYWLWVLITFAILTPGQAAGWLPFLSGLATALIYPEGHLWFIYCLPLCFVLARVTRGLLPLGVWIGAAAAHIFDVQGEPLLLVYLTHYFVFFYTGHVASPLIFRFARGVADHPVLALLGLGLWAGGNGWITHGSDIAVPGLSLILGVAGGMAITTIAVLLQPIALGSALATLGARSIVVYLGFFIPLKYAESLLIPLGLPADVTIALALCAGIAVPLWLYALLKRTGVGLWLFERPAWARPQIARPQPALDGAS